MNRAGLDLVESFEGFSAVPYLCPAGVWTIGYGSTRVGGWGVPVMANTPKVTKESAEAWMNRELDAAGSSVDHMVKVHLTENQKAALQSFTYNLGAGNLSASTLLRKLNQGDYLGAAAEFPKWNMGGGRVLPGLVRRRAAERVLFETP